MNTIKNKINNYFKDFTKYFFVIVLYLLYQSNFLLSLISSSGLKVNKIARTPRIFLFTLIDLLHILIILFMFRNEIKKGLKDLKENFSDNALISIKCWMIGSIVMITSSWLITMFTKQNVSENEKLVRESIKLAPLYMLFSCSIVAPIFEEMVFRRALYGILRFKWLFILVSGLGFGFLHVLGSYKSPVDFLYVIPYGAMGSAFAYLLTKTKNITLPIIIHMVHNTILVTVQIIGGLL